MRDIRIIKGRYIVPDEETALKLAGYRSGSPDWETGRARFQELEPEIKRHIQPKAALAFIEDRQERGLFIILTLGSAVTRRADAFFDSRDYLSGVLFDAMAGSCLFAFEKQLLPQIKVICQEKGCGIACRHEAGMDIPLSVQAEAAAAVAAERTLGVRVTEDMVLLPAQSMCIVFDLSRDPSVFRLEHDCRSCTQNHCPTRGGETGAHIPCRNGQSVWQTLQEQGIFVPAPCGGKGLCGKCRIRVCQGQIPVTAEDAAFFSAADLQNGWRLACRAIPDEDIEVIVPTCETNIFASLGSPRDGVKEPADPSHSYGAAVDIGTTTLAVALVDMTQRRIVDTVTALNRQTRFGADVISRIQAANTGRGRVLQQAVQQELLRMLQTLLHRYQGLQVTRIAVAGNTTMEHLFMGYSCSGLGTWPFSPVSLGGETVPAVQVFGKDSPAWMSACTVTLLPGISTYVGADITAGLWACGLPGKGGPALFLDLGTNGEMALAADGRITVASAPAGPALEGGNISCGTGSIPGAICGADMLHGRVQLRTIADAPPVGICGTGVIEATAMLLKSGILDAAGKLQEPYFHDGFLLAQRADGDTLRLTQKDIREIQMAKGAIRAGMEVLMAHCGIGSEALAQVYVAGGFGYYLNPEKAAAIGLLPADCIGQAAVSGNTSLAGAAAVLTDERALADMQYICRIAEENILGNDDMFQTLYIQYMNFDISRPLP